MKFLSDLHGATRLEFPVFFFLYKACFKKNILICFPENP